MKLTELGKKPIPGGAPAGRDVRSDPDFEIMSAEIEKLSSPSLSGAIDWRKVVDAAGKILDEKSKDLLVMTYLCVALQKSEGLTGLAAGVHVLREGVETFWEEMFPVKKRMRGRKNAVEWLADRLRDDLPAMPQEQMDPVDRDRFLEDLNSLDRFLAENMEDAPILIPLVKEISERIICEEKTAPPQETTGPTSAPPGPSMASQPRPAPIPVFDPTDTDVEKTLNQAFDALGSIATALGSLEPPVPLAFRLNRISAWTQVTELPPATGSKTLIPGPDSEIVGSLQNLYQSHNWKELAEAAEPMVHQFLFWFDLSRYVAESLEQLGCREGADMVGAETLLYLRRLPGVERLSFEDGKPFADETTRSWLRSLQEKQGGTETGNPLPDAGRMHDDVEEALVQARKLVQENKTTEALRQFNDRLSRPSSMKEKLLWQQGLCRLFFEIEQPRLAVPQMQDMLASIETHKIEQWEPNLAIEAFAVILTGLRLQPEKDREQLEPVLNRLAKLDPVKALDFM